MLLSMAVWVSEGAGRLCVAILCTNVHPSDIEL